MIITTNIKWTVGTRCDVKEDRTIVSIENVVTGTFDEIGTIYRSSGEWPSYKEIRETLVRKLLYNQTLSWQIARFVCHELRIPYERQQAEDTAQISDESKPLVSAVPQPGGGLSDAQIRKAASTAGFSLHQCLSQ